MARCFVQCGTTTYQARLVTTSAERALRFDREYARNLRALAYRTLGSRAEAEDIVQEAWLRWADVDESTVEHTGAYLSRLVTNLCLDKLGSASCSTKLITASTSAHGD